MIHAFGFIGMTAVLIAEGYAFGVQLVDRKLATLVALPLAALINTLAVLTLTVIGWKLHWGEIIGANIAVSLIFFICIQPLFKRKYVKCEQIMYSNKTMAIPLGIRCISIAIIASSFLYGLSHSLLPTLHNDSASNWNMRSKVSYYRAEMVFDASDFLTAKPQYPFLYHALQIESSELLGWTDTGANMIHLLLTLSCFGGSFILLKRVKGSGTALLVTALIAGIPLMTLHLGGSYADITLVGFSMLSLSLFLAYLATHAGAYLLLSGLFASACVWTKSEGLLFCFIPWICLATLHAFKHRAKFRETIAIATIPTVAALLWPVFAWMKGLSLTPHGETDTAMGFSSDAVAAFSTVLFSGGSFGVFWYGLLSVLALTILSIRKTVLPLDRRFLPSLLWGLLTLGGYMAVYLLTSNAEYLIIGQAFDRQMLLPAALTVLSLAWILTPKET